MLFIQKVDCPELCDGYFYFKSMQALYLLVCLPSCEVDIVIIKVGSLTSSIKAHEGFSITVSCRKNLQLQTIQNNF